MQNTSIKILIEEEDTPDTLKQKAKDIFMKFINKPIEGWKWEEICVNQYVIIKIFY